MAIAKTFFIFFFCIFLFGCVYSCSDCHAGRVLTAAEFDWNYLCDLDNTEEIKRNISNRKGVGDIDQVVRFA